MFDIPSAFPYLFTFEILGISLLRIVLGTIVIIEGKNKFNTQTSQKSSSADKGWAFLMIVSGFTLLIGIFTQVAAIAVIILFKYPCVKKFFKGELEFFGREFNYYALIITISVAILVLGPGTFSIDLPI